MQVRATRGLTGHKSSYNADSFPKLAWEAALNLKTHSGGWRFIGIICTLAVVATITGMNAEKASAQAQTQAAAPAKATSTAPAKAPAKKTAKPAQAEPLGPPNKAVGTPSAPITMEVFSDYECPQCRNLFENTLRPMMNDYVASGKVYLIHRDFPLPMHKYSMDAARWATAAARIGKFEEVDAAIYDNQAAWTADGNLQKYVAGALNPTDFKRVQKLVASCLTQSPVALRPTAVAGEKCSLDDYINQDMALGRQVPVQATPTYVITSKGSRLPAGSGFVSWPIMKQFLDSLMTK